VAEVPGPESLGCSRGQQRAALGRAFDTIQQPLHRVDLVDDLLIQITSVLHNVSFDTLSNCHDLQRFSKLAKLASSHASTGTNKCRVTMVSSTLLIVRSKEGANKEHHTDDCTHKKLGSFLVFYYLHFHTAGGTPCCIIKR
jgi:hypothetical protein